MAKKDKPSVDKIVKNVRKEFEKTTSQVEGMLSEAMKRFNEEVDRRMKELHELQDSLLERFGKKRSEEQQQGSGKSGTTTATAKPGAAKAKTAAKSSAKAKSTASKAADSKPAAKPAAKAKSAARKPAASKSPAAKPAAARSKTAKPAAIDKSDLKQVKGIGPATEKKMKEAGITSIEQIANPSEADREKLKSFAKVRGSESWTAEAKKLL